MMQNTAILIRSGNFQGVTKQQVWVAWGQPCYTSQDTISRIPENSHTSYVF
ncbi:MAG: hypothetical protein V3V18_13595 [Methylococcales bacterium]